MAANWNPFPADLQAEPVEREFSMRWRDRIAGLPDVLPSGSEAGARRTCRYLYTNIAMDAKRRIMPCGAAPGPDADLVFANAEHGGDHFNSEKYRLARLSFANPERYRMEHASSGLATAPYCTTCDCYANHGKAHVDGAQVKNYFAAVGAGVFNPASLGILSSC